MPEEVFALVPILVGVAILIAVVAIIGLGLGWLSAHPVVILVFCGLIGFLVWRSAQRSRV